VSYTPEQLAKLPKWAQSEITNLTGQLTAREEEIRRITENEPSNTWIAESFRRERRYLPANSRVVFRNGTGTEIEVKVNGRGAIEASSDGRGRIAAIGNVSNVIGLDVVDL
jgi:hypothetical protein